MSWWITVVFAIGYVAGFGTLWFIGDWFGTYADFQLGRGAEPSEYQLFKIRELLKSDPMLVKSSTNSIAS